MTHFVKNAALIAAAIAGLSAISTQAVAFDNSDFGRGHGGRGGYEDRFDRRDNGLDRGLMQLRMRIDTGMRMGKITRSEGRRLLIKLESLERDVRYANRSGRGVDRYEYQRLEMRLDRLSAEVRYEKNDRDTAYGYNDGGRHRW